MEGELRAARRIQAALLPEALPDRPDRPFTLRAVNEPAKRVAGDFFDF
ncbi:MAG TPA: serine/threonine protein phosphatase, partial [Planctomycetaceae bacterium]|nr:serine/threonine protein phosphatase [Planctomycetaceae bacterium]